jgi:hypothetical protein
VPVAAGSIKPLVTLQFLSFVECDAALCPGLPMDVCLYIELVGAPIF